MEKQKEHIKLKDSTFNDYSEFIKLRIYINDYEELESISKNLIQKIEYDLKTSEPEPYITEIRTAYNIYLNTLES